MGDPFAHLLPDGAVRCVFCPRECRLARGAVGTCGALAHAESGLRPTRPARSFRMRVVAAPVCGLAAWGPDGSVLEVITSGSGLGGGTAAEPAAEHTGFGAEEAAFLARAWGARGVHLATDDALFGIGEGRDILDRARAAGLKTALTTSGFLRPATRALLLDGPELVNLRLWSTSPTFYARRFGVRVEPVLATAEWLAARPGLAVEVTIPLVPGVNDSEPEIRALVRWIGRTLGPATAIHFEPDAVARAA